MLVWLESFHGFSNPPQSHLASIYGESNFVGAFAGISADFADDQPGLSLSGTIALPAEYLRMGPGITGNHNFSSRSKWYVHFAYSLTSMSAGDTDILVFEDTTVFPSAMEQCKLRVINKGPSGNTFALTDASDNILVESSTTYSQSGIYYLQLYVQIGAAAESQLIVSGVEQWDATGLDTQTTANATANAITFRASPPRGTAVGNIVIADDQDDGFSPPFNQLLGDFVVIKLQPNAIGDAAEFAPVGVSENWDAVNDYPAADDDTTYNETNAVSAKDVHEYEDVPENVEDVIYGVNLRTRHRKTEAGSRQLTHILKPVATEYERYTHAALDTWQWFSDCYDVNPETSSRYTKSELDAHQFGYKGEAV